MTKGEGAAASGVLGAPRRLWARTPLRVKLVAVMLALVAFALFVIAAGSVVALRDYLLARIDQQLAANENRIRHESHKWQCSDPRPREVNLPTHYLVGLADTAKCHMKVYDESAYTSDEVPLLPTDTTELARQVGSPFTLSAPDHRHLWRMKVIELPGQQYVTIGEDMTDVDSAVDQLVLIDTLVGVSVMAAAAAIGIGLVQVSLWPLVQIEQTAAAIAGGDLARRVPELDSRTEVGQLSTSLNTMLTQIEKAFRDQKASEDRAVRSEERMRQFVADASHELRTPLTTIRGFAELYRQGAAPDPAEVLRRIEDEAARMGLLVEDLLLLARLDEERPLQLAPVALADLITDAADAAHAVAPERPIDVDLAETEQPLVVNGDEARLRQIVGNLVTNALTHTPEGTPVALRLGPDGPDHAVIEVSDSGPGLTDEQAQHVFERFYRVDKARTRRAARTPAAQGPAVPHSGAGLGLAIVAALVAAHQGSVEVETAPGEGAKFRVRLPLTGSGDDQ